ncbi:MAG: hypothetical protein KBT69_02300 [Oceanihabitans sp.]|nr:hypothetical protein [Oceanihabitans sp.]
MAKFKLKYFFLFCAIGVLLSACVSDLDFTQGEDFAISPTLDASLIYFEETASSFIDEAGAEQIMVRDSVNMEIFNDSFTVDNLIKAAFLFKVSNSINRGFQAQIDFLDETDGLQHRFTLSIAASPTNEEILVEHLETFENESLLALKRSVQIVITVSLMPSSDGSIINENTPGILTFKSKATFYLLIDTST